MSMTSNRMADLKARLDIVEVAGRYTSLKLVKRDGHSYYGLCPLHNERTPSFHVDSAKQRYKCFGCGAGGDAIDLLSKLERLSTSEVLKRYGTADAMPPLPPARPRPQPTPPAPTGPPKVVERASMEPYLANAMESPLIKHWAQWYDTQHLEATCQRYLIGHGPKGTMFYQTNAAGQVLNAKVQQYHANGKRHDNPRHLFTSEQGYLTGCFGAHLLAQDRATIVCIVEGEKNAFAGALHYPAYVWIATGSASKHLPPDTLNLLKYRQAVMLWPDNDEAGEVWLERLADAIPNAHDCQGQYSSTAKGWDLADEMEYRLAANPAYAKIDKNRKATGDASSKEESPTMTNEPPATSLVVSSQAKAMELMQQTFALELVPDDDAQAPFTWTATSHHEDASHHEDDATAKQVAAFFSWYPWPQQPLWLDKATYISNPPQFITSHLKSISTLKGKARAPYIARAYRFMMALNITHI